MQQQPYSCVPGFKALAYILARLIVGAGLGLAPYLWTALRHQGLQLLTMDRQILMITALLAGCGIWIFEGILWPVLLAPAWDELDRNIFAPYRRRKASANKAQAVWARVTRR